MKPNHLLALVVFGTIFGILLIFRTELARNFDLLTEADMGLRSQMIVNYASYEQACVSWRGAVRLLRYPLDPTTYSDFHGIIEPGVFNANSLEKQAAEAMIREAQAESKRARLRETADWSFFKSWLASTTNYTHGRWKCNRPDESDKPVKISLHLR